MNNKLISTNPADNSVVWEGFAADVKAVNHAIETARNAFEGWVLKPFDERLVYLQQYHKLLEQKKDLFAKAISDENGKPLWEAKTEVAGMLAKLEVSVSAYHARTPTIEEAIKDANSVTQHRPHGVLAIIGPFNFPAHIPNGQILPALLAGNTVVFKPSELTPYVGELLFNTFIEAGLPEGVLNLVQGGGETGHAISTHPDIDGLLFTGSYATGKKLSEGFAEKPEKILALEMGGNNPLVVDEVKNVDAAILVVLQSAYITSGQRCTCARRLIIPKGKWGDEFIQKLAVSLNNIRVDVPSANPEPFMGPLISAQAGQHVLAMQEKYIREGADSIVLVKSLHENPALLSPGLIDVTNMAREDEEVFGPLLKVIRVENFEAAIKEANNTRYGLSAGIVTEERKKFERFYAGVKAGLINWNKPTTGARGAAPFGGVGCSGNNRAAGFYTADLCAYPCVSVQSETLNMPEALPQGIHL